MAKTQRTTRLGRRAALRARGCSVWGCGVSLAWKRSGPNVLKKETAGAFVRSDRQRKRHGGSDGGARRRDGWQRGKRRQGDAQRGRKLGGVLTSVVAVAEVRGRGEAATDGGEKSSATGRKSETEAALRGVPGSGEEAKRELVLWRFHSRTEEAPAVLVAAAR